MRGLTRDTWLELLDRKLLWVLGAITILALLIIWAITNSNIMVEVRMGGDAEPVSNLLSSAAVGGLDSFLTVLIMIIVLATASLIPQMLEKGRAEFFLSKPLTRQSLVINKLFGMLVVYGGVVAAATVLIGGFIALQYGLSMQGLLWLVAINLLLLFVWLTITTSIGILFNSGTMAIISAFLVWVIQKLLSSHELYSQIISSEMMRRAIEILYYAFPKPSEISDIGVRLALGQSVTSWMPIWTSVVAVLGVFMTGTWVMSRRDY